MKAHKITNPLWLGQVANLITDFHKIIRIETIGYEQLFTYFANTVQFGGNLAEFWVVFDDDTKPVAFAHWMIRGLPHRGCAYCDFVYSKSKDMNVADSLFIEFGEFATRNRCPYLEGDATNETTFRLFSKVAERHGYSINKTKQINFLSRKKAVTQ